MKIGVISDIHDNIANLQKAFVVLNKEKVKIVFFYGDLTSPFTIDYFRELKAPVKAIFGNNEGDKVGILERIKRNKLNFEYAPKQKLMWDIKLKGKRIAVFHGHQPEITNCIVKSRIFDIVLTAHNHDHHIKKVGRTLWINPGAVASWAGLDFKKITPTIAIVDLQTKKAKIITL